MRKQFKDRGMMWIAGPCKKGMLIPKPPIKMFRPKANRFVNWSVGENGKPYGTDFVREVPRSQWHLVMIHRGDIRLARPEEIKAAREALDPPKPKVKKDKK